jgi:DNA-binding NtrC family response regulator
LPCTIETIGSGIFIIEKGCAMTDHTMTDQRPEEAIKTPVFGKRKVRSRVCIADAKQHIRTFLGETLEELGFVTCECAQAVELSTVFDAHIPDLVVLGLSGGGIAAGEMVKTLAANKFGGKVLLLGPHACPVVTAVQELGEELGIAMLPTLRTPFSVESLRESVPPFCPPKSRRTLRSTLQKQ